MATSKSKATKAQSCILAGDIGGTKTRLGLFIAGKQRPVARVRPGHLADLWAPVVQEVLSLQAIYHCELFLPPYDNNNQTPRHSNQDDVIQD